MVSQRSTLDTLVPPNFSTTQAGVAALRRVLLFAAMTAPPVLKW
jgi:hypothetical protein